MPDNQPSTPDSAGIERTATGAVADKGQTTTPAATTPQTSTTTETTDKGSGTTEDKSLLNRPAEKSLANQQQAPAGAGAPEAYEAFNVPEGYQLDEETSKEVGGLFKAMNLTQEQGQQLIDFHVRQTNESFNAPYEAWRETQKQWVNQVRSDPFLGPRLNQVTTTISKAIDFVTKNNPRLGEEFRAVMDSTGAGNNPHFIRMFYEMAAMITEGGHVAGRGPSPGGQKGDGTVPTAARAMYPNLP